MKNYAHTLRYSISGIALLSALLISGAQFNALAQETSKDSAAASAPASAPAQEASKESSEPVQVKIRGPRDPFVKYVPPVRKKRVAAAAPVVVPDPSIQARIEKYKAQKLEAMNRQQPAPKPTTALLLSEMQVVGIFRTPRGYAAMVEATPIKLSYVIYPGEMFYDGQLVAIEEDRLVFRHETRWSNGKVDKTVENKPLRQPNPIAASMAATRAATDNGKGAAATTPAMGDEKAPTPEKQ